MKNVPNKLHYGCIKYNLVAVSVSLVRQTSSTGSSIQIAALLLNEA